MSTRIRINFKPHTIFLQISQFFPNETGESGNRNRISPPLRESKTVLESGFQAVDSGFQDLDSSLCQWNLDSGFQSLVGFRTPWPVSRIPKPRISDSTNKNLPDSRIRIPLHGATPHCFETALQSGGHMNPDKKICDLRNVWIPVDMALQSYQAAPSGFFFLVQIRAFVINSQWNFQIQI